MTTFQLVAHLLGLGITAWFLGKEGIIGYLAGWVVLTIIFG